MLKRFPADKLNLSATNPSGIINPIVVNVPHFDGTTDLDLGRPVDGPNGLRSQYQTICIPIAYKKGRNLDEIAPNSHPISYRFEYIPIDALPAK